jgi:type I restriction enzyme S subunit
MTDGFKLYRAYRDSGVSWLGEIPEHWEVCRLKYVLREYDSRSIDGTEQLLRVSQFTGVTERKRADGGNEPDTRAESLVGYKRVQPNDLVVNIMLAWNGSLGISSFPGITSPAYCVYRFGPNARPWYFHHLLRSPAYKARIKAVSTGVVESRLRLYTDGLYRLEAYLPPLSEQDDIVRFLDHADQRIRRYIRAKQKLIKLLEEQKQVTIQGLVTRRFQEQLPFDILGRPREVRDNKDWLCATVGHLTQRGWLKIQDGNHGELHPKADDYVDDGIPFLMANDVRSSGLNLKTCSKISEDQARRLRIGFAKPRDVLLTHKATIGQVGMVPDELPWPFLMLTPQVTYYRCKPSAIEPLYLFAYMQTAQFQQQIAILSSNQSTRNYIGILEQRNLVIPIPTLEMQAHIVREFRAAAKNFNAAAERARQEIELLREYVSRLTADVVTGKLDVREAAARLPQRVSESESLDEIDDLSQDESAADGEELEAADAA